jgi:hypothetical protein
MPPPKVDITPRAYLEGCACCDLSNGSGDNFRPPIQTAANNSTTSTHLQYYHPEPRWFPSVNPAELSQISASYRHFSPSHEDMYQTSSYCTPPPTPTPLQAPMTHSSDIQHQPQRCLKCNACVFPPIPSWNLQPQTMIISSPPNRPPQLLQPVHNPYAFSTDPMQLMYTTTTPTTTTANFTAKTTPYRNVCAACQQYVSRCAICQQLL